MIGPNRDHIIIKSQKFNGNFILIIWTINVLGSRGISNINWPMLVSICNLTQIITYLISQISGKPFIKNHESGTKTFLELIFLNISCKFLWIMSSSSACHNLSSNITLFIFQVYMEWVTCSWPQVNKNSFSCYFR